MSLHARYTVDPAKVVSEVIDGEAILINLANGYYYSLDSTGAAIWSLLQAGRTAPEIVSVLRSRYDCSHADPEAAVQALIATLEADELISSGAPSPGDLPMLGGAEEASGNPFRPPTLERFSDMQGFLLMDPIHEVDDTGWPNVKPGGIAPGHR
ncbi:MAG TPA: PqqD family protein [Candidatus Methylomirabilis sp.]|nr:PqqD family protein [Candidatus Methylomirabilis sp.]